MCDLAVRMHLIRKQALLSPTTEAQSVVATDTTGSSTGIPDSVNETDFEKPLDNEPKCRRIALENQQLGSTSSSIDKFRLDFSVALKEVQKIYKFSKLDVLEAVEFYPKIVRNVAYAVTALPATQVSVERLFFAHSTIHLDLRASMKEDLLEEILFLRVNSF